MNNDSEMFQELPENIRPYFRLVYNEVVWLQAKWDFYQGLFGSQKNSELLFSLAQISFIIIENSLRSDMTMAICRLGDSAQTKQQRFANLSFEKLVDISGMTNLSTLLREFTEASSPIRINRNKVVGHNDLETVISRFKKSPPTIQSSQVNQTLRIAWQIINAIYNNFVPTTAIADKVLITSGAPTLIHWLQLAERHKDDLGDEPLM